MLRVISADVFEVVVVRSIWCIGVDARVAAPSPSAWEVCGAVCMPPADSLTCGHLDGSTVSDRDYPQALLLTGTQRARSAGPGQGRRSLAATAAVAATPSTVCLSGLAAAQVNPRPPSVARRRRSLVPGVGCLVAVTVDVSVLSPWADYGLPRR